MTYTKAQVLAAATIDHERAVFYAFFLEGYEPMSAEQIARTPIGGLDRRALLIRLLPKSARAPFALWCVRQIWQELVPEAQALVETAERFLAGTVNMTVFHAAGTSTDGETLANHYATQAAHSAACAVEYATASDAIRAARLASSALESSATGCVASPWDDSEHSAAQLAELVRLLD